MKGHIIGGYETMTDSYQVLQMLELYHDLKSFGFDNYFVDAKRDLVVFVSSTKDIRIEEAEIKTILQDGKYTEFYPVVYKEQDKAIFFFKNPVQDKSNAKWQAERMYSEEDLKEAYKSCYTPLSFGKIGDLDEDFKEWFEQYKKEDKQ